MTYGGERHWPNRNIHLRHISDMGAMKSALRRIQEATNCSPLVKQLYQIYTREAAGNLEGLSKRSGVSRAAVRRWAKAERDPKLSLFEAVAESLGYEVILRKKEEA